MYKTPDTLLSVALRKIGSSREWEMWQILPLSYPHARGIKFTPGAEVKAQIQGVWADDVITHGWKSDPPSLSYLPYWARARSGHLALTSYPVRTNFLPFLFPPECKRWGTSAQRDLLTVDCWRILYELVPVEPLLHDNARIFRVYLNFHKPSPWGMNGEVPSI